LLHQRRRLVFSEPLQKIFINFEFPVRGELHPARGELHPARGELHPARGELHPVRGELHSPCLILLI